MITHKKITTLCSLALLVSLTACCPKKPKKKIEENNEQKQELTLTKQWKKLTLPLIPPANSSFFLIQHYITPALSGVFYA